MAIRVVRRYPDPALRAPAQRVPKVTKEIKKLIRDLFDTLRAANGVGLAAPQVGVSKRVLVVDLSSKENGKSAPLALVNPTIVSRRDDITGEEGCLSFPVKVRVDIRRAARIKIKALNANGKAVQISAVDLLSRTLQHEIDHLDGILFIDRMSFSQKLKFKPVLQALEYSGP